MIWARLLQMMQVCESGFGFVDRSLYLRRFCRNRYSGLLHLVHKMVGVMCSMSIYVYLEHPQISATWAAEVGSSVRACWLIEQHQNKNLQLRDKHDLELLRALQFADSQN